MSTQTVQSTTGKEIDPNGVDHPSHYNLHPSGVECIEVKRYLPSNLSDAFKYVFRRGEKGDPVKDLNKAVWYLRDEIIHLDTNNPYVYPHHVVTNLVRIIETEPVEQARAFYECVLQCLIGTPKRELLIDCLIAALRLSCVYCQPEPPLADV